MNKVYDTDVLIIGAGLAGSALAYRLRQHGLRVLLAERGQLDTLDKLCAGALAESVEESFDGIYGPGSLGCLACIPPVGASSAASGGRFWTMRPSRPCRANALTTTAAPGRAARGP